MSVAFRMIADQTPPPLPNPGNIGPRPVTSAQGADLVAPATVTNLAAGKLRAANVANVANVALVSLNDGHGTTQTA